MAPQNQEDWVIFSLPPLLAGLFLSLAAVGAEKLCRECIELNMHDTVLLNCPVRVWEAVYAQLVNTLDEVSNNQN